MTGNVTFAFQSYTAAGQSDLSWELGTVAIVGGSTASGQAALETMVPPGLVRPGSQQVDVVAMYGGDANHLASTSPKVSLSFAPLPSFQIVPPAASLPPSGTRSFVATNGTLPIHWYVTFDTTASESGAGYFYAYINESTGLLTVGSKPGYVEIAALDAYGAGGGRRGHRGLTDDDPAVGCRRRRRLGGAGRGRRLRCPRRERRRARP